MKKNTNYIVKVGMLSALSFVLMYAEIPMPMFASFLKLDFADVPALLGGLALGPIASIVIILLRNILHFFIKNDGTGGVGNLANFLVGIGLCVPAAWYYIKHKNRKHALIGLGIGIISMAIIGILSNMFILLPFYGISDAKVIRELITTAITPFNLVKGTLVSIIVFFSYKPLSSILHKKED